MKLMQNQNKEKNTILDMDISPILNQSLVEDDLQVSDNQKQELESLYDDFSSKFKTGGLVTGKIIDKDNSGVWVNIGYKSDGFIPNFEFSTYEYKKIEPAQEIEVVLDRLEDENGWVVLSYQKAKSLKAWDNISELAEKDEPVRGMVTNKVKGGLSVDVGIPAFLPGSQVDTQRVADFDQYVGQEVICKILKINKKRGNVIISRRKYLEEQRAEDRKQALDTIKADEVLQGTVKNITSYGVFVDVGGIDGLLHITDMSWGRIAHPSEMVRIGDTITVKVISFDKQHEKISLGIKQLTPNPWEKVEDKYPVGSKVKGRVSSITDYGLFVEVEKGIEGLVHISEVSWTERITNLHKHFKVNDEVEVAVVAIDKENRRMSLSIKQLEEDPWEMVAKQFNVGDKINGKITNITDFGLFVQLLDGVDGLVHISDLSWTEHVTHPSDKYKKGDVVEAVILALDPDNRKVSLGIKQLEKDPWENIEQDYPVGTMVEGIVSKITNFGAFIKLATGIEGLVHISEISDKNVEKIEDVLTVGQTVKFKVIKVSKKDRKLGLSLKTQSEKTKASQSTEKPNESSAKEQKDSEKIRHAKEETSIKKEKQPAKENNIKNSLQEALEAHFKKQNKE
ncbi:MAG: 30S ribosomal protein S1 [bacterium]